MFHPSVVIGCHLYWAEESLYCVYTQVFYFFFFSHKCTWTLLSLQNSQTQFGDTVLFIVLGFILAIYQQGWATPFKS